MRKYINIINLTIVECKYFSEKPSDFSEKHKKSNHSGM